MPSNLIPSDFEVSVNLTNNTIFGLLAVSVVNFFLWKKKKR